MEWQPIETAPKDEVILLYRPDAIKWAKVAPGKWEPQEHYTRPSPYWEICLHIGGAYESRKWPPTHWMPLPEPPK